MSAYQRTKGASWEREWADMLRKAGYTVRRTHESDGQDLGYDITSSELDKIIRFQCKVGKTLPNVLKTIREIPEGSFWKAAVMKQDRRGAFVAMPIDDWLMLFNAWHRTQERTASS